MRRTLPTSHHRAPRRIVSARCQVVRERDFRLIADRVVDLSPGGALVMPADPCLTGEKVIVSFQVPYLLNYIDAEATVARVVHGRRPGEYSRGLALHFDHIESLEKFLLERALNYLPPAPPRYRAGRRDPKGILASLVSEFAN